MQISLLNLIAPAAPAAAPLQGDGTEGDSAFADLLGAGTDGLTGDENPAGQQHAGELAKELAAGALIAQEVDPAAAAKIAAGLQVKLDALSSDDITAIKRALTEHFAAHGETPRDDANKDAEENALRELLDTLDSLDASADVSAPDTLVEQLPVIATQKDDAARSELASRILGFIQSALKKAAPEAVAAQAASSAALPGKEDIANAALFRTAVAAPAEASQPQEKAGQEETPDAGVAGGEDIAEPTGAFPLWVQNIGAKQAPAVTLPTIIVNDHGTSKIAHNDNAENGVAAVQGADEKSGLLETLDSIDKAAKKPEQSEAVKASDASQNFAATLQENAEALNAPSTSSPNANVAQQALKIEASSPQASTYTEQAKHAVAPHPVADQVLVAVKHAKEDGINRITIQLQPNDLGHVEVKLESHQGTGETHVVFTADKADTLDMLQRDVRALERSLQDAGIKADAGTMEFNLRQQPQPQAQMGGQQGQGQQQQPQQGFENEVSAQADAPLEGELLASAGAAEQQQYSVSYGVDVRV